MSKRNSIVITELRSPLRRSPRFVHHKHNPSEQVNSGTRKSKSLNNPVRSSNPPNNSTKSDSQPKTRKDCPKTKTSDKLCRSDNLLRKSPRLNSRVVVSLSLRRSPRISNKLIAKELVENWHDKGKRTSEDKLKKRTECSSNKSKRKSEMGDGSCEQREMSRFSVVLGLKAVQAKGQEGEERNVEKGTEEIKVNKKRKRGEEGKGSSKIHGWTKEQEMALQRAYFATKPTPHFWKNVSKQVPGKSAQECFDKVHSDHVTPPQPRPWSRANKMSSSPLKHFSLSASKLLKPIELKVKSSSRSKQKSHLPRKTVRHLLRKNYHVDEDCEADLFSVLEPNINLSAQVYEQNGSLSTPKHLQAKHEFLQKCREISSGRKKPLSRFSDSCGMPLVSPPVLKQIKNRALHEKYIDHLHCREAKRKAESARAERFIPGKENRMDIHSQNIDVVRAAKNTLVTDARNVINQLQHNENTMSNTSDLDCGGVDCDDDEGESEL